MQIPDLLNEPETCACSDKGFVGRGGLLND